MYKNMENYGLIKIYIYAVKHVNTATCKIEIDIYYIHNYTDNFKVIMLKSFISCSFYLFSYKVSRSSFSTVVSIWPSVKYTDGLKSNMTPLLTKFSGYTHAHGVHLPFTIRPRREKTSLRGFANNKGADQPARIACASAQTVQRLCYPLLKVSYLNLLQAKFQLSS